MADQLQSQGQFLGTVDTSLTGTKQRNSSKDVKKAACQVCGKFFKFNWEVTRHMKSHTGEKPFSCTYCDYRCSHKHHLKTHMIRHLKLQTND